MENLRNKNNIFLITVEYIRCIRWLQAFVIGTLLAVCGNYIDTVRHFLHLRQSPKFKLSFAAESMSLWDVFSYCNAEYLVMLAI